VTCNLQYQRLLDIALVSGKPKRAIMDSQLLNPNFEAAIWARLMQAQRGDLSPEAAEYLLSIGFEEGDRCRMQQLADSPWLASIAQRPERR
jgi:hypothetical protein